MFPLACQVQSYDWGKRGTDSAVAKLKGVGVDDSKPYAELWMGTHPSGPARVAATNELLADWLRANPSAVGHVPAGYAGSDLPFLFKVLSIQTALSIQAHPDKALARDLHARYPDVYKDPNHKPEMAIALTPFEAMCGFRPVAEIKNHLAAYPELEEIVGADACGSFVAAEGDGRDGSHSGPLRGLFRAFMDCPEDKAKQQVAALVARLSSTSPAGTSSSGNGGGAADDDAFVRSLIVRLNRDYPGDRGALCPLLLNCLRLAEGEAFFMGPNEPHAYISGDCVEAMALSDNVVRAGLTPKFRDVETLCTMLTYSYGRPQLLPPRQLDAYTLLYRPPPEFSEFEVEVCTLPADAAPHSLAVLGCASVLLFFKGATCTLTQDGGAPEAAPLGSVVFLAAGAAATVRPGPDGNVFFRAHINLG